MHDEKTIVGAGPFHCFFFVRAFASHVSMYERLGVSPWATPSAIDDARASPLCHLTPSHTPMRTQLHRSSIEKGVHRAASACLVGPCRLDCPPRLLNHGAHHPPPFKHTPTDTHSNTSNGSSEGVNIQCSKPTQAKPNQARACTELYSTDGRGDDINTAEDGRSTAAAAAATAAAAEPMAAPDRPRPRAPAARRGRHRRRHRCHSNPQGRSGRKQARSCRRTATDRYPPVAGAAARGGVCPARGGGFG